MLIRCVMRRGVEGETLPPEILAIRTHLIQTILEGFVFDWYSRYI